MKLRAIRIVMVGRRTMIRQGLRILLERETGFRVVAEIENSVDAASLVQEHSPDVVIIGVSNRGGEGQETIRDILRNRPSTKIVWLAMYVDRSAIAETIRAGASGYLLVRDSFEDLATAVRAVHAGKSHFSPRIADAMADIVREGTSNPEDQYVVLTTRERQVLQLMAGGKSTRDIASQLRISPKTVETHRKNIMDKLELRSIAELTKYAIRHGITSLD